MMVTQLYSGQTSYLNMKVLWEYVIFANLSYDQKCSPFDDHTNVSHDIGVGSNFILGRGGGERNIHYDRGDLHCMYEY